MRLHPAQRIDDSAHTVMGALRRQLDGIAARQRRYRRHRGLQRPRRSGISRVHDCFDQGVRPSVEPQEPGEGDDDALQTCATGNRWNSFAVTFSELVRVRGRDEHH